MCPCESESISFEWKSSIGLFAQGSRPDDLYYSQNPNLYQYLGQDDEFMRLARPRFERIEIQIIDETEIPLTNRFERLQPNNWDDLFQIEYQEIPHHDFFEIDPYDYAGDLLFPLPLSNSPGLSHEYPIISVESRAFLGSPSLEEPHQNCPLLEFIEEDTFGCEKVFHHHYHENEENQEDLSFLIVYSEIPKGQAQKKIRSQIDQYSGSKDACSKIIGRHPERFRYLLVGM